MRRILAALILAIAPLPAAPALPAHAQAVPGTLLSISPTSGARGSTVRVTIEAGGIQPQYTVTTGPGIQVTSDQLVLVDGFSSERLLETFVIAAEAPLGPSSVSVVGSNGTTNSLAFEITPAPAAQQSVSVAPGATATAAVLPTLAGQSGLSASLTHSALATSPATLVTTRFTPIDPCAPVGLQGLLGCTDLQVLGAATADVASARFYFADRCTPGDPCSPLNVCQPGEPCQPVTRCIPNEPCIPNDPCQPSDPTRPLSPLRLLFFNDVTQTWATACSSGNRAVTVDAAPNLDGTVSAFRISAVFDSTSTPTVTALGGTRFAAVLVDTVAPTSTATPKPGPLPAGLPLATATAGATVRTTTGASVGTISPITCFDTQGLVVSLNAADDPGGSGVDHLTTTLSSPGAILQTNTWITLPTTVSVSAAGLSTLTHTARDVAGNQEATHSLSVVVGTGADDKLPFACAAPTPTFSLPAHGSLVLTGTLTVSGQSKSFTKTVKF